MPLLVDRELSLYHSGLIVEYLDERFPHPPLLPVYPVSRAQFRLILQRIEKDWAENLDVLEIQILQNHKLQKQETTYKKIFQTLWRCLTIKNSSETTSFQSWML